MDWTETKLSKGADLISYFKFLTVHCTSRHVLLWDITKCWHIGAIQHTALESFLCWTATYLSSEWEQFNRNLLEQIHMLFSQMSGIFVSVTIPLFVYLLFLSHCSSFSTLSENLSRKGSASSFSLLTDSAERWQPETESSNPQSSLGSPISIEFTV